MRVLGASVLAMESILMGFALLLAKDHHSTMVLWAGGGIAIAMIVCAGLLKKKFGWFLGTLLQIAMVGYGAFVPSLFIMGTIFLGLWIAAIIVGRKGEAARAALISTGPTSAE